ncbi:putative bifunctional diguanylate cyclase/phosphodiesterase [Bacillus sp. DJP31]|uniref:putative bifunctional diguanylate cyclase/phosphodiesterase n=1 Tax=Bacillus sp. DJP31 TaxID=3409789 RepID=UPI003BB70013
MITSKKTALTILLLTIAFVYLWNILLYEFELITVLGSSLFPILVGFFSFLWVYKTYRVKKGKEKYSWLVLAIGLVFHVMGNFVWFYQVIIESTYHAPDSSYLFWLFGYFLFLLALVYRVRLINPSITNNPHLFNTLIFLIVILSISVHYLVKPYIAAVESPFQLIVIGFIYPVVDTSLLFVTTLLYFLSRHSKEKTIMLFFMGAFYLQIFGDSIAAIMKTNKEDYQLLIEPMWVGSLLMIGFAGLFARKNKQGLIEIKAIIDDKVSIFPYITTILLFVLEFHSNKWQINTLGVGLGLVFFLIIGKHLYITQKNKKLMMEYRELAYKDSLTELLNRSSFKLDLEYAIKQAENSKSTFTLLLIDLDRFKMINDTLGHIVGDRLLQISSQRLKTSLAAECGIYRLGGDEFVVLVRDTTKEKCVETANQIISAFKGTFIINHHEITITPSVGISSYPFNGTDSESLFKAADAAMYVAKGKGRNNYQFYNSELNQALIRKMILENELRKSMDRNELELFYQPKFNLLTKEVTGMEALLRWNSQELGPVSPVEFIPIAEDTGLIVSIGEWVLQRACMQNKEWQDQGYPFLCVSVNVSVQQFTNSHLVKTVEKTLRETGLNPKYLELEITESIMQNVEESIKVLTGLRGLGLKIALDDFGTGYSSLHVLKDLPIHTLKIDKTFIDDITDEGDQSMVKGIIDIARNLNLEIVAEGVEHEYQVRALAAYHCDYGQGFLFARPVSVGVFEKEYLGT